MASAQVEAGECSGSEESFAEESFGTINPVSKKSWFLVTVVGPEGFPQRANVLAVKIRGGFATVEDAQARCDWIAANDDNMTDICIIPGDTFCPFPSRGHEDVATVERILAVYKKEMGDYQDRRRERIEMIKQGREENLEKEYEKAKTESLPSFDEAGGKSRKLSKSESKSYRQLQAKPDSGKIAGQNFAVVTVIVHKEGSKKTVLLKVIDTVEDEDIGNAIAKACTESHGDFDADCVSMYEFLPYPPPPGSVRFNYSNEQMQATMDDFYGRLEADGHKVHGSREWNESRSKRVQSALIPDLDAVTGDPEHNSNIGTKKFSNEEFTFAPKEGTEESTLYREQQSIKQSTNLERVQEETPEDPEYSPTK
jgi:hypothetical protein